MKIAKDITALIGQTPLVQINRLTAPEGAQVVAKVESFNPASSVKDRVAAAIVDAAEASGQLLPGGTLVEATSGNTGVALAMVGAARGYKVVITMPESMSKERRALMQIFGAELILTPAALGMQGTVEAAEKIVAERPGAILANQFANPANPAVHENTTAQEIWRDTDGQVDVLVAGIGTGGTISGTARALRKLNPDLKVIGVEPTQSPLLTAGQAGPHKIQGIGANFIPDNLDQAQLDEVMTVDGDQAIQMARRAAAQEGLLVGISAGAALVAATQVAAQLPSSQRVVVVLPDTGERYLSTELFSF